MTAGHAADAPATMDAMSAAMTNQHFGELVGCSHSMASRLINGNRLPGADLLGRISRTFDIPLEELMLARIAGPEAIGKLLRERVIEPADQGTLVLASAD